MKRTNNALQAASGVVDESFDSARHSFSDSAETITESVNDIRAALRTLGKELLATPVGQQAKRNPWLTAGIIGVAAVVVARVFRL